MTKTATFSEPLQLISHVFNTVTATTEGERRTQTMTVRASLPAKSLGIDLKPQEAHGLQVGNHWSAATVTHFRRV